MRAAVLLVVLSTFAGVEAFAASTPAQKCTSAQMKDATIAARIAQGAAND